MSRCAPASAAGNLPGPSGGSVPERFVRAQEPVARTIERPLEEGVTGLDEGFHLPLNLEGEVDLCTRPEEHLVVKGQEAFAHRLQSALAVDRNPTHAHPVGRRRIEVAGAVSRQHWCSRDREG